MKKEKKKPTRRSNLCHRSFLNKINPKPAFRVLPSSFRFLNSSSLIARCRSRILSRRLPLLRLWPAKKPVIFGLNTAKIAVLIIVVDSHGIARSTITAMGASLHRRTRGVVRLLKILGLALSSSLPSVSSVRSSFHLCCVSFYVWMFLIVDLCVVTEFDLVSMTLILGLYGTTNVWLGPNSSFLIKPTSVFVQTVIVCSLLSCPKIHHCRVFWYHVSTFVDFFSRWKN